MRRPCSKIGKIPSLRTWIRQTDTPRSSLLRLCHWLGSVDEQWYTFGVLMGSEYWNRVCQSECWHLQAPPLPSQSEILSGWTQQIPLLFPWGKTRVGAPMKWPQHWGHVCNPWALSSYWKNHRLRGDLLSWFCTGLGECPCCQIFAIFLTILTQSVLVLLCWSCFSFTPMF